MYHPSQFSFPTIAARLDAKTRVGGCLYVQARSTRLLSNIVHLCFSPFEEAFNSVISAIIYSSPVRDSVARAPLLFDCLFSANKAGACASCFICLVNTYIFALECESNARKMYLTHSLRHRAHKYYVCMCVGMRVLCVRRDGVSCVHSTYVCNMLLQCEDSHDAPRGNHTTIYHGIKKWWDSDDWGHPQAIF